MAAFACFSKGKEKNIDSYKEFIERLQRETKLELGDTPLVTPASSFQYHLTHKKRGTQHVYKDFIYRLNMKMHEGGAGILICENPTPTFTFYIRLIERTTLPDGNTANAYYGEIRRIVTAFMNYFTTIIDDTGKKINKHTHFLTNKLFVELIDETEEIYETNHLSFLRQYRPLNSEIENARYQKVKDAHEKFIDELNEIRDAWEYRQDKFEEFAKKTFERSMQKTSDLFNFTHCYISMMLADRLFEISVSLKETANRLKCNLEECKEICKKRKNMLIINLYEKNKESLNIHRRTHRASVDNAEVSDIQVLCVPRKMRLETPRGLTDTVDDL